ncbi:DUF1508 domain-containing protein [Chelatococcus sambhunathii]|uniref:DUF1508 domain-containing protein n=1 Tax=Chelatococcus sambhunathii TaxID=363953 RepID=A0ABU1DK57_9HYPH|nr:YegP family protein [Chelatococcus sambhunathii]MDR4308270.1 DUF1508 domain-containing protein [Chelatococcus sambhunathii]
MAKFKIKKSSNGQYFWVFVADNGEPICTSETYTRKESALNSIRVVKEKAAGAAVEEQD